MPRGIYKSRVGTVISDKMDKTVVVNVIQIKEHPRYAKAIKRNTTFKAHDENERCQVGDKVLIIETKPKSKTKRWRVSKILERSRLVEAEIAEAESGLAEEEAEIAGMGVETEEPPAENTEFGAAAETPEVQESAEETQEPQAAPEEAATEEPEDKGGQG